jgi:hypothetical protein
MFFIINDYGNGGMHRCDGSGLIGSILPKISRRHHRAEYRTQRFFTNVDRQGTGNIEECQIGLCLREPPKQEEGRNVYPAK